MFQSFKSFFGFGQSSLANPSPDMFELFGARPTAAGVHVSAHTAMRCSTVYACVKVLAESVAQLPLILYRRTPDGGKERATDHSLFDVLGDLSNPWTSSFEFRSAMQAHVLCHDHGSFAYINRVAGQVQELLHLPSSRVVVEYDPVTCEPRYKVTDLAGRQTTYGREDILHLRTMDGLSPVTAAREAIALAIVMEQHGSRVFGAGARPSGVLKVTGKLGKDTMATLRDSWNRRYGGAKGESTVILEEGLDFQPLQFNSVDLQFLEMRAAQVVDIARAFRIPPPLIQDLGRATWSNTEQLGQQFLSMTLLPWLKLWEGAIRRSLLTEAERPVYFAEFMIDDLVRADLAARMEAYSKAITNGILSPNEARAMENRPPHEGGDQFRLPMNTENAADTATPAPKPTLRVAA